MMYQTVMLVLSAVLFANSRPQFESKNLYSDGNQRYASDFQSKIYDLGDENNISILSKNTKEIVQLNSGLKQRYAWHFQPSQNQPLISSNSLRVRLVNGVHKASKNTGQRSYFQNRIAQFALDPDDATNKIDWPAQSYEFHGPQPRIWTVDQLIEYIWLGGKNTTGIPIETAEKDVDGGELIPFICTAALCSLIGGNVAVG